MKIKLLGNVVQNAFKPGYAVELAHKVKMRVLNQSVDSGAEAQSLAWCEQQVEDYALLARRLDPVLWAQSEKFADDTKHFAEQKFASLGIDLGQGGGNYALLYFVTRRLPAETVVETGVAAGFSSQAVLEALKANGGGKLYSSDFPLFRHEDPERWIGILVDDELKKNWELHITGDRKSLPEILKKAKKVDLFHFDSDKTVSGREFALSSVEPNLSPNSIVVMDDIQNNLQFRDYVAKRGLNFKVFCFEGKYQGVIGWESLQSSA